MIVASQASPPLRKIRILYDLKCLMRDGLELSTDVYLPAEGGPFPVLLNRNPYNNLDRYVIDAVYFAQRGYAAVTQDVRGRWGSPGEWSITGRSPCQRSTLPAGTTCSSRGA